MKIKKSVDKPRLIEKRLRDLEEGTGILVESGSSISNLYLNTGRNNFLFVCLKSGTIHVVSGDLVRLGRLVKVREIYFDLEEI